MVVDPPLAKAWSYQSTSALFSVFLWKDRMVILLLLFLLLPFEEHFSEIRRYLELYLCVREGWSCPQRAYKYEPRSNGLSGQLREYSKEQWDAIDQQDRQYS